VPRPQPTPGPPPNTPPPAPPTPPRSAREVIDAAIRENRRWDWLCFGLLLLFAPLGGLGIVVGIVYNQVWPAVGGSVSTAACPPVLWFAYRVWRKNVEIRLLEFPLSLVS